MASKLTYLGLKIPKDLYRQLKGRAKERRISVSELCREHLESVMFGKATLGDGQGGPPLTKADLEGLLTKADLDGLFSKADLKALERLLFSVIVSERLLLKNGSHSKQLLAEVATEAQKVTDSLFAKLGTKPATKPDEAKS